MVIPILVGIGAFVILAVMFALLWLSSREDEQRDSVTQEIIIKANTAPVKVQDSVIVVTPTQEKED